MVLVTALFGDKNAVSLLQECARAALIFGYGLLLVRVAGRRIAGKWSGLDFIVSIIAGSSLSRALTGSAPLFGTLAAITLLFLLHWAAAQLAARLPAVSHVVEGRAIDLLDASGLKAAVQKRHSVTEADLDEALRQSGLEQMDQASKVILEPSGKISVLKSRA